MTTNTTLPRAHFDEHDRCRSCRYYIDTLAVDGPAHVWDGKHHRCTTTYQTTRRAPCLQPHICHDDGCWVCRGRDDFIDDRTTS